MKYFSDKEIGPKTRTSEVISHSVWIGIVSKVSALISKGAFGQSFPEMCHDGNGPIGTDAQTFRLALQSEIPDLEWPVRRPALNPNFNNSDEKLTPNFLTILDFIQFCHRHVAKPVQDSYHKFFNHYHLTFDIENGKNEFREYINRVFARNGIVFELQANGDIIRLAPPGLKEILEVVHFNSGDTKLDSMLCEAHRKFLNPDSSIRKEAVERLWDSWERLKTITNPRDKRKSMAELLDKAANESNFRSLLENEATLLTQIGNNFHIRHSEVNKIEIEDAAHWDYLFHRLLSMVLLLLKAVKYGAIDTHISIS